MIGYSLVHLYAKNHHKFSKVIVPVRRVQFFYASQCIYTSVLWYCWLGLLTCKNRLPYNLYCVGRDVKHCSIQSNPVVDVAQADKERCSLLVLCSFMLYCIPEWSMTCQSGRHSWDIFCTVWHRVIAIFVTFVRNWQNHLCNQPTHVILHISWLKAL